MAAAAPDRSNSGLPRVNSSGSSVAGDDGGKGSKLAADVEAVKAALSAAKLEAGSDYDPTKYALSPNGELISLTGSSNELITCAAGEGIPHRGGKVFNRHDWLPMKGEATRHYLHRLVFEGHTVLDAFLLTANCDGQIVLTNPWALFSAGVVSGSIIWTYGILMGLWTTWNYMSLYLEYKRDKIRDGSWWETDGKHKYVAQWFDVVGHHLGKWARYFSIVVMMINLTGSAVVQTVASANSLHTINTNYSKRQWSLIMGGSMVLLVVLTPKFTKFRLVCVIGLLGTFYASMYGSAMANKAGTIESSQVQMWPVGGDLRPGTTQFQNFFNGASIMLGESSGHDLIIETMESMENPSHYWIGWLGGLVYILFVTMPQAYSLNLSKYAPQLNQAQNMYSLFAVTSTKIAGVAAIQTHNYVAYLLWGTQFCIIAEKVVGIHTKPYWIRALMRVPFALFWLFLALMLPFYGAINSLLSSLGSNLVSFVLLAVASLSLYRHKERRDACPLPPFKFLQAKGWIVVHLVNLQLAAFFLGFGVTSLYYAILTVKQDYSTWGFMPECYGC